MMRPPFGPLLLACLLSLTGCQGVTTSRRAGELTARMSERTYWFNSAGGMRFQAVILVRSLFAEVPLTAFISVDKSRHLDFVGLSDWGFRLAEASLSLEDPAPTSLHPMLARIPRLGSRLSLALQRVFLIWPQPEDTDQETAKGYYVGPQAKEKEVHYAFHSDSIRPTEKNGLDARGPWRVLIHYTAEASPQAAPEKIVYQGDGLEIVFKLKELNGDT